MLASLAWILLCCLAAGLAGVALKLPTIWGEGLSVLTYGLPWPLGWGLLHLPPLAFGVFVLAWPGGRGSGRPGLLFSAALGLLIAGGVSAWNPQFKNWQMHPWTLFLLVDGLVLLPFALLARSDPQPPGVSRGAALVALVLPLVPVALFQWSFTQSFSGARVAMTSIDPQNPTLQRVLVVIDKAPATMAEGCAQLAKLAPDPYPGSGPAGGSPQMHRILELKLRSALQSGGRQEPPPLLTYEWKPGSPKSGECRAVGFTAPRR